MSKRALLEKRKGQFRNFTSKALKAESLEDVKEFIKKAVDVANQIAARACVSEDRVNELEEFSPQTLEYLCPECSYKTQFSMPGSDLHKKQIENSRELIHKLRERIKAANQRIKELSDGSKQTEKA